MNTMLILMAQFGPRVAIPVEEVRREYFAHLDLDGLLRKISQGAIRLPIVRADKNRRTARFISMVDLAMYLDTQMEEGRRKYEEIRSTEGARSGAMTRFINSVYRD